MNDPKSRLDAFLSGNMNDLELGQTELGQTELGQTELGQTELGQTELGQTVTSQPRIQSHDEQLNTPMPVRIRVASDHTATITKASPSRESGNETINHTRPNTAPNTAPTTAQTGTNGAAPEERQAEYRKATPTTTDPDSPNMHNPNMLAAKTLMNARKRVHMSRKQLGTQLDIHQSAVWMLETGKLPLLGSRHVEGINRIFQLSPEEQKLLGIRTPTLGKTPATGSPQMAAHSAEVTPEVNAPSSTEIQRRDGAILRAARERMNMKQSHLAKISGVSGGHICQMEQGKYSLRRSKHMKRLISHLDLTPEELEHFGIPVTSQSTTREANVQQESPSVTLASTAPETAAETTPGAIPSRQSICSAKEAGKILRKARQRKNISINKVAEQANMSSAYLRTFELGYNNVARSKYIEELDSILSFTPNERAKLGISATTTGRRHNNASKTAARPRPMPSDTPNLTSLDITIDASRADSRASAENVSRLSSTGSHDTVETVDTVQPFSSSNEAAQKTLRQMIAQPMLPGSIDTNSTELGCYLLNNEIHLCDHTANTPQTGQRYLVIAPDGQASVAQVRAYNTSSILVTDQMIALPMYWRIIGRIVMSGTAS